MIKLGTGRLPLSDLRAIAREAPTLGLDPDCMPRLEHSHAAVTHLHTPHEELGIEHVHEAHVHDHGHPASS